MAQAVKEETTELAKQESLPVVAGTGGLRDPKTGRWLPGHPPTHQGGNRYTEQILKWRQVCADAGSEEDIRAVLAAMLKAAKKGSVAAAKLWLERICGKQPDIVVNQQTIAPLVKVLRGIDPDKL